MIPKECKRLAEVDFPIAVVSKHAARVMIRRNLHDWEPYQQISMAASRDDRGR